MFLIHRVCFVFLIVVFLFKQKTAYEMRISDWSSDVCSSDLREMQSPYERFQALEAKRAREEPLSYCYARTREEHEPYFKGKDITQLKRWLENIRKNYDKLVDPRSEERRVGKECVSTYRSRWSP